MLGNALPAGGYSRLDKSNWLPLWLQAAGYRTMHVGKFLNGYGQVSPQTEVPPGFNDWHGTVDPSTYTFYGYTVNENGTLRTYGAAGEPEFYSTDFFARRANDADRRGRAVEPALLPVGGLPRAARRSARLSPTTPRAAPRPPWLPRHTNAFSTVALPRPASFNEADVTDKPAAMQRRPLITDAQAASIQEAYQQRLESLLAVDEAVASIVAGLQGTGELDDTLILFTSDNGFFHGEHRVRQGKLLVYEPSIRLPLLMRGPGVPAGERRSQLVTNADLAPTILDAADATPGRPQDGRSLFGLIDDPGVQWGRELLLEGGNNSTLTFTGLRNYRWKYVEHASGEAELYDLAGDPDELTNVAGLARAGAAAGARWRRGSPCCAAVRARAAGRSPRCGSPRCAGAAGSSRPCAATTPTRSSAWSSSCAGARSEARRPAPRASGAWRATPARLPQASQRRRRAGRPALPAASPRAPRRRTCGHARHQAARLPLSGSGVWRATPSWV